MGNALLGLPIKAFRSYASTENALAQRATTFAIQQAT